MLPVDQCRWLVKSFIETSWKAVEVLVGASKRARQELGYRKIVLYKFQGDRRVESSVEGVHFFLRGSIEYSNPQLTIEELQGIIGARLLEVCANYFAEYGLHTPDKNEIAMICEDLANPPEGLIIPFLLNTDDVEPDRYSMNPLRASLRATGQTAYPAATVHTYGLKVDSEFVDKYENALITRREAQFIGEILAHSGESYVDYVDSAKYAQLGQVSEMLGMDLRLSSIRLPLEMLRSEAEDGLLHYITREVHRDYDAVKQAYNCMGRSMSKRTTLLTVPHSKMGYGSKRAARGRLHFNGSRLESVTVKYQTTQLYPNSVDPNDVSVAEADDAFEVPGEALSNYRFAETPSSPQFFLYALASPENAALWHGVGAFAAPQLLQSYTAVRKACMRQTVLKELQTKYGVAPSVPVQLNLVPKSMWVHPVHRNIDASVGTIADLTALLRMGMVIENLPEYADCDAS